MQSRDILSAWKRMLRSVADKGSDSAGFLTEVTGTMLSAGPVRLGVSSVTDLMVGMSATADIVILEHTSVLLIPERAVQPDENGNPAVKVPAGEEFQFKPVVLGMSDGFNVEVLEGLEEGEEVVVEVRSTSGAGGLFFGE